MHASSYPEPPSHTALTLHVLRIRLCSCSFDPLGLGANPESLKWFRESELVHSRWAMLAVAGILVQVRSHAPACSACTPMRLCICIDLLCTSRHAALPTPVPTTRSGCTHAHSRTMRMRNKRNNRLCILLTQEIVRPDVFWYSAGATVKSPFGPLGLLAFEFFAMHWVEVRRWQDLRNPGSVDQDPIFTNNKLPPHEVGLGNE